MFRETVTHAGGTSEGAASETHALMLLRRAVRHQYTVEATTAGGALITWSRAQLGTRDGEATAVQRSITLAPHIPVGTLGDGTRQDLTLIGEYGRARYALENGRQVIVAGFSRIPPYATARLRARGLVTEDETGRVRLTLPARLGLLAHEHRTRTTEPGGWTRPADAGIVSSGLNKPGRRNGLLYSGASSAVCTCGLLTAVGGSRDEARLLARRHREAVTAEFVTALNDLTATPAATVG